jgi:hypothetical protein
MYNLYLLVFFFINEIQHPTHYVNNSKVNIYKYTGDIFFKCQASLSVNGKT